MFTQQPTTGWSQTRLVTPFWIFCATSKPAGSSARCHESLKKNGQHAQAKHVSTNISDSTYYQTEESQSAWSNQSANQPIIQPPLSNQRRGQCLVRVLLARMPKGLGQEALTAEWLASAACQSWAKLVWSKSEWETDNGSVQVTCITVGSLGSCHHSKTPKLNLHVSS